MALKLTVKPGEKIYVGNAEISVQCDAIVNVLVGGHAPILRSEDYLAESDVQTPAHKLQHVVQQMYLSDDIAAHHDAYFSAAQELLIVDPSCKDIIARTNSLLMQGAAYKAIKLIKTISNPELSENRTQFKLVG